MEQQMHPYCGIKNYICLCPKMVFSLLGLYYKTKYMFAIPGILI